MLVEIKHLKSYFFLDEGVLKAVDDVSFAIDERESAAPAIQRCDETVVPARRVADGLLSAA